MFNRFFTSLLFLPALKPSKLLNAVQALFLFNFPAPNYHYCRSVGIHLHKKNVIRFHLDEFAQEHKRTKPDLLRSRVNALSVPKIDRTQSILESVPPSALGIHHTLNRFPHKKTSALQVSHTSIATLFIQQTFSACGRNPAQAFRTKCFAVEYVLVPFELRNTIVKKLHKRLWMLAGER